MTSPIPATELKERRQLCDDLEYLCIEDTSILATVIDEFVYYLKPNRFEELQEFARSEMEADL